MPRFKDFSEALFLRGLSDEPPFTLRAAVANPRPENLMKSLRFVILIYPPLLEYSLKMAMYSLLLFYFQ
jgi:hypothetical protein